MPSWPVSERDRVTRPCEAALAMAKVPAKRWRTRAELFACVEAAKALLDASPHSRLTLADVGRACGLSPYHLQRYFSRAYGISPRRYLAEVRWKRARALVEEEGASVAEACFEVGFASPSTFSRMFRARFGVPPSQLKPVRSRR